MSEEGFVPFESDSLYLCDTDWLDSAIFEVIESNSVPLDSLIITGGKNVLATFIMMKCLC